MRKKLIVIDDSAYSEQAKSLILSNAIGSDLEKIVRQITTGKAERLFYSDLLGPKKRFGADVQMDCVLKDNENTVVLSITHTKPNSKGHSNENKFQLKLGELWLLKTSNLSIRVAIVVGGRKEDWLPWCLEAFRIFFDEAIFQWEDNFDNKIKNWQSISWKHKEYWETEQQFRKVREDSLYLNKGIQIPNSYLRENIFNNVLPLYYQKVDSPSEIKNDVLKKCMMVAELKNSVEWQHFRKTNNTGSPLSKFWEKRTFFNPSEATVEMTLIRLGNHYLGSIASDVEVPNFLTRLAKITDRFNEFNRTKMSEDFVLKGTTQSGENKYVYIQCKSSGGGMDRHGKAIQNRAKEQIARGLLYRTYLELDSETSNYKIISKEQNWIWITVVDGDWGTNKTYKEKYIHMLILAGYDYIIPADSLVNKETQNLIYPNPLSIYVENLNFKWNLINFEIFNTTHDEAEHGKPSGSQRDFEY